MTETTINTQPCKSRRQAIVEYILLAMCLCIVTIRTIFTESPTSQASTQLVNLGDNVYSLAVSAVLILAFLIWIVVAVCERKFSYRPTATEAAVALFIVAGLVGIFAASNKRDAITSVVILTAPMLMAILLVQILDSPLKVKLVLAVIAALGVVSAYQCTYQLAFENQQVIEQYEQSPQSMLGPLGIKPGSFNHMLFEHRIYSKDVKGFFTTSNSAGSFMMLAAFAAIAMFAEKLKNRKPDPITMLSIAAAGIAAVAIIIGLVITRSKGAIAAAAVSAAMFAVYLLFSAQLKKHRKAIVIACLVLIVAGSCAVIFYGSTRGTLPGGNSMLVRWQYWKASAQMFADHPLTGVGPGNFGHYYPHYKPAAALESVSDPHNFLLTILTQFGPLGLAAFLAMILMPLWRVVFSKPTTNLSEKSPESELVFLVPLLLAAVIFMMSSNVVAGVFIIALIFVAAGRKNYLEKGSNISIAALFCGVTAVLIHNTIDFAIFEPGVMTAFWATIACIIALDTQQKGRTAHTFNLTPAKRTGTVLAAFAIGAAFFHFAFTPPTQANNKVSAALNYPIRAHDFLDQAAQNDPLGTAPLHINGKIYLQQYYDGTVAQPALLEKAKTSFLTAAERDPANFKSYEKLATIYNLLGDRQKAYEFGLKTAQRYPGLARIQFELAETAEKMSDTTTAIGHYKKAVEIEDAYRQQFKIMYPGRKIFSRLGEEKYNKAKAKILEQTTKP